LKLKAQIITLVYFTSITKIAEILLKEITLGFCQPIILDSSKYLAAVKVEKLVMNL